jgi:hypothetical protein
VAAGIRRDVALGPVALCEHAGRARRVQHEHRRQRPADGEPEGEPVS